jgi:hypothetical protein
MARPTFVLAPPKCRSAVVTTGQHALVATDLRDPWFRPDPALGEQLRVEAIREINPGHELHGVGLECVARCSGCDDTAFRCDDGTFAVVHLTWQAQEQPPSPRTTRVLSFVAFEMVMDQHEH